MAHKRSRERLKEKEREARKIALHRSQLKREAESRRFKHRTLEQIGQQIAEGEISNLDVSSNCSIPAKLPS